MRRTAFFSNQLRNHSYIDFLGEEANDACFIREKQPSRRPDDEQLLKLKYIHTSANWNHPQGRRDGSGLRAVYINAPTEDGIRVQHPHVADWKLW